MTSAEERQALLRIARRAIAAHLAGERASAIDLSGAPAAPGGAFVTLRRHEELRGCIGHIEADGPVGAVVARCAVASATEDPRFPAVTRLELVEIAIELSLLGPLETAGAETVEVGRHGLVVEMGWRRGLLLPQVATERNWDRETFLAETCHKAGLPGDAWEHGATLEAFTAEVFSELPRPALKHKTA